jgi:uncharacterized protein (TIGR02996 family)
MEPSIAPILADPWRDDPRLAWASAVESQGQTTRARFVRDQLRLAQLDFGRPRGESAEVAALRQRTRAVAAVEGQDWAGPLAFMGQDLEYIRGFVERVRVSARVFVDRGDKLFEMAPIHLVRIDDVAEVGQDTFFACPHLSKLVGLDLSYALIGDKGVEALSRSPHLRGLKWLSLFENKVGLEGAEALAASPSLSQLEFLNFGNNRLEICARPASATKDGGYSSYKVPFAGADLARRFGPKAWLGCSARTLHDWPPDPYLLVYGGHREGQGH